MASQCPQQGEYGINMPKTKCPKKMQKKAAPFGKSKRLLW
jgi:hypothetical protein